MVVLDVREVGHLVRLDADDDPVGDLQQQTRRVSTSESRGKEARKRANEFGERRADGGTNPGVLTLPPRGLAAEDVHVDS